jgi:hypothetical protein
MAEEIKKMPEQVQQAIGQQIMPVIQQGAMLTQQMQQQQQQGMNNGLGNQTQNSPMV